MIFFFICKMLYIKDSINEGDDEMNRKIVVVIGVMSGFGLLIVLKFVWFYYVIVIVR